MTTEPPPPTPSVRTQRVIRWSAGLMCVGLAFAWGRVAQLQLWPEAPLAQHISDHALERPIPGPRGALRDRRGRELAISRLAFRVIVDPERLDEATIDDTITALAEATGFDAEVIGDRILSRMDENDARREALGLVEPTPTPPSARSLWSAVERRFGGPSEDAAAVLPDPETDGPRPLIRYLPLRGVVDPDTADRVRALRLAGVHLERAFVRERVGSPSLAPLVGKVDQRHAGLTGLERRLDPRLAGEPGRVRMVRDAGGRPLWVERGQVVPAYGGEEPRLSFDLQLQRLLDDALAWGVSRADAAGGRAVAIDPVTGEVLAIADLIAERDDLTPFPWVMPGTPREARDEIPEDPRDRPRYRVIPPDPRRGDDAALTRVRTVVDAFEPGSIFKPFAWAVASSAGVLPEDETLRFTGRTHRTEYGRLIQDAFPRDELTWSQALVNSSNRAMAIAASRISPTHMRQGLTAFGFGSTTGVGVFGESPGLVTRAGDWTDYTQTSVAFGQEIAVTPVQMARAFSAFARNGELAGSIPQLTLLGVEPDAAAPFGIVRRAIAPDTAMRTRAVMQEIAEGLDRKLRVVEPSMPEPRYSMFGKSGTAEIPCSPPRVRLDDGTDVRMERPVHAGGYFEDQFISSYVAGAPLADPRIVVLVVIEDPGPARIRNREFFGSDVAGPVVRRFVEDALPYMGVRPDLVVAPSSTTAAADADDDAG